MDWYLASLVVFTITTDIDASVQESCTIIPTSPTDLDPMGGVIADGTHSVTIECSCNNRSRIRWFFPNTNRIRIRRNTPPGVPYIFNPKLLSILIIPTFTSSTSGIYTCGLDNEYPPLNMATIYLTQSLVFATHPSSVTTGVHTDIALSCKAAGLGPIDLAWVKNGSSLPARHKILIEQNQHYVTSTLTIQDIIGYDMGYYYCVATSYAGNIVSQSAFLNVTVPCPEVVTAPENITVKPGGNASFDCVAWSHGRLFYYWYIEYTNSTTSYYDPYQRCNTNCGSYPTIDKQECSLSSYTTEVHSFKVINADEQSNEGWYCCVAVNECGNTSKCGWLEVDTSPIIIQHPSSHITVRESSYKESVLKVVAIGKSPIIYQWEKYSFFHKSWSRFSLGSIRGETSSTLKFRPVRHGHEGVYHCIVSNADGSVTSNNASVTVYGPPTITFVSANTTVFEGNKAQLLCDAVNDIDSVYRLQIIWFKRSDGIKLPLSKESRCSNDTCSNATVTDQLLLDPVSHHDAGEYTCRAFNHHQSYTESRTFLTVEYAPKLTVYPSQSPYTVKIGGSLFLLCSASGLPRPTVQWYRNGSPIISDPLPLQQFYIVPTLKRESINYTCVGRNNAGGKINVASTSVFVKIVLSCPHLMDPPNGKVFISNMGDNAIFTCENGYTIRGTSLLTCNFGTSRWSTGPPTCTK